LAIREKALGPEHPDLADSLVGLAEIALQGGRAADAVRLAKRAVLVRQKSDTPALELAQARFLLARALIDAGKSQVDAIALAEQARDAYRKAGGDALVEVERWLDRSR
jgi:predicted methyltransferase MtxX (methanogen marker protein 4)